MRHPYLVKEDNPKSMRKPERTRKRMEHAAATCSAGARGKKKSARRARRHSD